jgi:hypothetical protein
MLSFEENALIGDGVAALQGEIDGLIREGEEAERRLVALDDEETAALLASNDDRLDAIERERTAAERRQKSVALRLPSLQEQLTAALAGERDKRFRTKFAELQRSVAEIADLAPRFQAAYQKRYLALSGELRAIDDRRAAGCVPTPPALASGALVLAPDLIGPWIERASAPLPAAGAPAALPTPGASPPPPAPKRRAAPKPPPPPSRRPRPPAPPPRPPFTPTPDDDGNVEVVFVKAGYQLPDGSRPAVSEKRKLPEKLAYDVVRATAADFAGALQ